MTNSLKSWIFALGILSIFVLFNACTDESTPRPKGYLRIALPEKQYRVYDSICPFTFDLPVYAKVLPSESQLAEPCWSNIVFPGLKATLHLSYKEVKQNLPQLLDDTRKLTNKHIPKASAIRKKLIQADDKNVYGMFIEVDGVGVASPIQFYLTDSTHHFIRGALYFNASPNADSLAPVIQFVKQDLDRLVSSFSWKSK
ncbi:MAG: gliding motility lipoprotein GldD [Bacteroidia bacterium]|nr:gliding motility lipoprotein GldD [Bacteroidia bacterium]